MSEVASPIQEPVVQNQSEPIVASPSVSEQVAKSLWNEPPLTSIEPVVAPVIPAVEPINATPLTKEENAEQILDVDDYFKTNFGVDAATAKTEWETLRKLKETPPASQSIEYANEESKRIHELIKAGKTQEVYQFLDRQMQLDKLEKYDINDVNQASEIIKANLQFKHVELSPQQINRLFERQYTIPTKPAQLIDQEDADYAIVLENWKKQVQEKEQDMIIDATLAKPELTKHKSQLVLPDIPQVSNPQPAPNQKELEAQQAVFIENFQKSLEKDYQNFKGFNVTAIDGEVQLPISYTISPEELNASKEAVSKFNLNDFFDQRWFYENGNPNITQIQEDLYLLNNRDKVFQKIANEASAQRLLHHQKIQNNIKLNGINQELAPPSGTVKTANEVVAENIWNM